ncbi:4-hydroxy-3-methylbut-2-enyl diphosphate reductase [Glycomyces harbinensis]|uniref:4-hydroxy-3-methylbut-2-enyl diphosphate reductase n=1 Tax=Glycomyces harbinensis TaxID=58114 RepID=A0A1G7D1E7_9ACTN|nr:4-hydroxy-3-methylbut-2-enyl diphosphate reductase [Glycomyces harbinensis]SDE44555.1 4-hydroxy-3-methylbut-2-enyl diphosphate reductase [Glycomyces harbinensis]
MTAVRRVLLPAPRSFCAGVERAIEIVERLLEQHGPPVYVRNQIVHNTHVVADLESRGAVFIAELDEVPEHAVVVFSAHGVAPAVEREAAERGLDAVDATCPLVAKVHAEAKRAADAGDTVILIGHEGHEEVVGTLGVAPERTVLVESAAAVPALEVDDAAKVTYLSQTTLSVTEVEQIAGALKDRFPNIKGQGAEDICYATSNRQAAVAAVVAEADLVLVVGSANSSNSNRLVELAAEAGVAAHLIEDAGQIEPAWIEGARTIAVTAGASAPPALVDEVVAAIGATGPVEVVERPVTEETQEFLLPQRLRSDDRRRLGSAGARDE